MNNSKLLYKFFIIGFFILYIGIALISFFHSIEFFSIGNAKWMAVVVGACFELGNFLSLAAILLSEKNKKATLPWILLIIMVSIQCIANTYSTFKFIALSNTDYYQYLAKPILFWIEAISNDTIQIIVSWIIGAILPIVALFMTDMVASNIKHMREESKTSNNITNIKESNNEILAELQRVNEKNNVKQLENMSNLSDKEEDTRLDNKKKFLRKLKNLGKTILNA